MKRVYISPTMTAVAFQQRSHILAGSITSVDGNANLNFEGGGDGTGEAVPMSRGVFDLLDF